MTLSINHLGKLLPVAAVFAVISLSAIAAPDLEQNGHPGAGATPRWAAHGVTWAPDVHTGRHSFAARFGR